MTKPIKKTRKILPLAAAAALFVSSLPATDAEAGGGWHGGGYHGNCRGGCGGDDDWAIAAGVVGGLFGIAAIAEAMRDPGPAPAVVYETPPPVVYQAPAVAAPPVVYQAPATVVVPAPAVVIPAPVVYAVPRPVYYYGGPPRPWGAPRVRIHGHW